MDDVWNALPEDIRVQTPDYAKLITFNVIVIYMYILIVVSTDELWNARAFNVVGSLQMLTKMIMMMMMMMTMTSRRLLSCMT